MLRYFFSTFKILRPTSSMLRTYSRELPSRIGNSSQSTSTIALSIPMPCKADIKCSIVETDIPYLLVIFVHRSETLTLLNFASISDSSLEFLISTLLNTMPVLAVAGLTDKFDFSPLCKVTPSILNDLLMVFCILMFINCLKPREKTKIISFCYYLKVSKKIINY